MAEGNMAEKQKRFADVHFKQCCEDADIKPTLRQASKWNMGKGKAFKMKNNIFMNGVDRV